MISPELLRRFPFFGQLTEADLKSIAMICEEQEIKAGTVILEECGVADTLYFLIDGSVDLTYKSEEEFYPKTHKEFDVGEINPGEPFGISAMIDPYRLNATAKAARDCRLIAIDAVPLRSLMEENCRLGFVLLKQISKATMERLASTRILLAAAWAE
jgi:CRP/FNR family transcriptional regulator, cyclic AMP receptor protein